ncbi:MAG: DMT family transporter [Pseudomonadota bacterium]
MRVASDTVAGAALLIGGAMWGLYWIPVRYFAEAGLPGSWPGVVMYLAALVAVSPALWRIRGVLARNWRGLILSGMFTGAAFSLYTTSLVYTDVVRSILLFYLTPIWGTALGLAFLGETLTMRRGLALICGLGGLFVVLGEAGSLPWPRNIGDWLALLSGIAWALGSLGLYRARGIPVAGQVFAFVLGALLIAAIAIPIELHLGQSLPTAKAVQDTALYAALSAAFVLPMLFLTIWPATRLAPARVGMILMSEVVVGLASAALFANEVFGLREAAGAALIVSAALLELAPTKSAKQA